MSNFAREESFDIIEWPFNISENFDNQIIKIKDGYEIRIIQKIDSKKVLATKKISKTTYFHVRIDKNLSIISHTKELYECVTPIDFYIPIESAALSFYSDLYQNLIYEEDEKVLEFSKEFNKKYINKEISVPVYMPPIVSMPGICGNYNFKDTSYKKTKRKIAIQIKPKEKVPISYTKEIYDELSKYGNLFEKAVKYLNKFVENHNIFRTKDVCNDILQNKYTDLSQDSIRRFFPMVAYLYYSGPWSFIWVKYGYDPTLYPECYKFQDIYCTLNYKKVAVIDRPEIFEEIEKNKNKYLNSVYDEKHGFFNEKCIKYLKKQLHQRFFLPSGISLDLKNEDLEFDTFD
ncbi:putative subunit of RNA polymerase III transcription factor [Hamiltosporidium magnivora]|uniref:Putative subunit of RNA polymerase III transcription factor n=1 Tax=Hamiltosporidium magnivora TaxID=148818 RepID=A0A4V2JWA1_9MICR|nr:putative subunit of RNA polymerase III transcription factor [Hamiltosporidium magnivora]